MPRSNAGHRGIYHPKRPPLEYAVDAADPESLWAYLQRFTRWQQERQYSRHTVDNRERTLRAFAAWAAERGLVRPHEITKPILERWQRHLYLHRKPNGEPLSARSQIAHIHPIKAFFKWLARENYILFNPASDLELPRIGHRLPRHILTVTEVEKVLAIPKISTPVGIRDRAMLETLYSTGVRRQELIDLKLYDVDSERGVVFVRQGKGKKDRMIPIGARALAWIDKYLEDVRPEFASGADDGTLFLTVTGTPFNPEPSRRNRARLHRRRGHRQARRLSHLPPHHGDADAGKRGGHPLHPGDAGSQRPLHDRALHPGLHQETQGRPYRDPSRPDRWAGLRARDRGARGGRRQSRGAVIHPPGVCFHPRPPRSGPQGL